MVGFALLYPPYRSAIGASISPLGSSKIPQPTRARGLDVTRVDWARAAVWVYLMKATRYRLIRMDRFRVGWTAMIGATVLRALVLAAAFSAGLAPVACL